jgi:branched-chain amino acid transport system permease protein
MGTSEATANAPRVRLPVPRFDDISGVRVAVISALMVFVLVGLPATSSDFWIKVLTLVSVYSIVALGLNLLMGRVGLVSLGQIAVLALAAWIGARLLFATDLPFPIVLVMTGLLTMVLGTIIGLPALRLSGLYLALVTLMLAGAITVVLASTDFPNGGTGFLGHQEGGAEATAGAGQADPIRRPSIAEGTDAYFRYTVIATALMFLLVLAHIRGKPGRAWAAIRQSEPAALAAGVNVTLYKLWAFALAAFITGVAGGLLAGAVRVLFNFQFATEDSIVLLAVVLMGGIYSLWGAIIAGFFIQFLPELLNNWGVAADLLIILFGVGVLQVLLTAPAGLIDQVPRDLGRLRRLIWRLAGRAIKRPADTASPP